MAGVERAGLEKAAGEENAAGVMAAQGKEAKGEEVTAVARILWQTPRAFQTLALITGISLRSRCRGRGLGGKKLLLLPHGNGVRTMHRGAKGKLQPRRAVGTVLWTRCSKALRVLFTCPCVFCLMRCGSL